MSGSIKAKPIRLCAVDDLVPGSGVAALVDGQQIALFYLPSEKPPLYAIGNFDPIGQAPVLARGIVGDVAGELVVASPLYKQHFSLTSGQCIEEAEHCVSVYSAEISDDSVWLHK